MLLVPLSDPKPQTLPTFNMSVIYTYAAFAAIAVILVRLLMTGRRPKNYPPGPPTLPIIGNLHQVQSSPHCHGWYMLTV